ncbi:MAG: hypothetical protein J7L57_07160 [Deltaproteobacteria bacterium]|nr:hypothetical protein [Candidatus Tharpella sp.]
MGKFENVVVILLDIDRVCSADRVHSKLAKRLRSLGLENYGEYVVMS